MLSTKQKKDHIKKLTKELLLSAYKDGQEKINSVLNSGFIEIEDYDVNDNPYIIPRKIAEAILRDQSDQIGAQKIIGKNKLIGKI